MKKVVVLGIDGLDSRLVEQFKDELPNIQKVRSSSPGVTLKSVFPPDTTPAWASIYTGLNPAEHGIINFINIADKDGSYKPFEVEDGMLQGKTFWDIASEHDKKVCILVPQNVYPGWDVSGSLVCRSSKIVKKNHPLSCHPETISEKYNYTADNFNSTVGFVSEKRLPFFAAECREKTVAEVDLGLQMLNKEDWDLFFLYISSVDGVQHYFWNYFDKTHPNYPGPNKYEDVIKDFYKLADDAVGEFLDSVDSNTSVVIISDHGQGLRPYTLLNLNEVLCQKGYLFPTLKSKKKKRFRINKKFIKSTLMKFVRKFGAGYWMLKLAKKFPIWKKLLASSAGIDWGKTSAYVSDLSTVKSYSYGGVRVIRENVKGDYDKFIKDLIVMIKEIRHPETSEKLVKWVCRKEDLYSGSHLDKYPEIVLELVEGFGLGWEVGVPIIGSGDIHNVQPGSHNFDTAVFYLNNIDGYDIIKEDTDLMDIAPTVLSLLGINVKDRFKRQSILLKK